MNVQSHLSLTGILGAALLSAMFGAQAASPKPPSSSNDWPMYNDGYNGQRFSPLDEINTHNVADLKPLCKVVLGEQGAFESGPIVVGNVLYVTTSHTTVAMDASDCKVLWRNIHQPTETEIQPVNRGAAYFDGRIFRGYSDGWLMAFNAKTGKVEWKVHPANPKVGEFLSAAPIAWHGLVFIGLAGSDWGIRGKLMAFDARSGKEAWHFWTVPEGNETGADTWTIPATIKHGGGGMWTSYTIDPKTAELFVSVANPSPDFDPAHRPGDNLYTDSVVVLDARTGKLNWWYQLTHNDGLDYDLGAAPMLYNVNGAARVALGSKDGHLYSLNRDTHKLLFKTAVTTIENPDAVPTYAGVHVCPGDLGGIEWNGPTFDPRTGDIYVGAVDWCQIYKRGKDYKFIPGQLYFGTSGAPTASDTASGWVTALDATSGKVRWKFHAPSPVIAGVTSTAGGLVLTGDGGGDFYAFDAKTGKVLMQYSSGGAMAGGVITYAVHGKQYVAFTSGNVSRLGTFNTTGSPTLVVMALNAHAGSPKVVTLADSGIAQMQVAAGIGDAEVTHGRQIFATNCAACHGGHGEGGLGPALQDEAVRKDLDQVIKQIKHPAPPMPKLYPSPLSEADVQAAATYVETLKKH